jgi:hypothetical protein
MLWYFQAHYDKKTFLFIKSTSFSYVINTDIILILHDFQDSGLKIEKLYCDNTVTFFFNVIYKLVLLLNWNKQKCLKFRSPNSMTHWSYIHTYIHTYVVTTGFASTLMPLDCSASWAEGPDCNLIPTPKGTTC